MAQFIYLTLLLATIQLPLVKVIIPCDLDGNDKAECDCFLCEGNSPKGKVITHLGQDKGIYLCNDSKPEKEQCQKNAKDCKRLDLQADNDVVNSAVEKCWNHCRNDSTCQYVKFNMRNKKCFLVSSKDNMKQLIANTSWQSFLMNCQVSTNDATTVNPSTEDQGGSSSSGNRDESDQGGSSSSGNSDESDATTVNPSTEDATTVNPSTEGLKFVEEAKSWICALDHCYGINSSLVEITDDTVRDAVKSLLQNKTELQEGVWIGLERSIFGQRDRPWMWISGRVATDDVSQWNCSLVDPLNNHCGKIIRVENSQELKWQDGDCHDKLPFICQEPPT